MCGETSGGAGDGSGAQQDVGDQPRWHLGFWARLHQAEDHAISQVGMPHDVRLRQRLGCEHLERSIHDFAGEMERMHWQLTRCKNVGNFSSLRLMLGTATGRECVERSHKEIRMPTGLTVHTPTLEIGYEAHGDATGFPVVLLHGFPDDVHAWDAVMPPLVAAGYRVLVPYLRGYGPTRFLDAAAPRMAQQAAIAQDLLDFMDALGLDRVGLAGYDWGGRAACITAILAPERVQALVTIGATMCRTHG